jgi:hypothetical protein
MITPATLFVSQYSLFYFSAIAMEGLPELGEYRQRLLGVQRDWGGHESRRFLERAPGKKG